MGAQPCCATREFDQFAAVRCVAVNWRSLGELDERWRADPVVVSEAISRDFEALGLAADSLRSDKQFVATAVAKDVRSIRFALPDAVDHDLALAVVDANPLLLKHCPLRCREDKVIALRAVARVPEVLECTGRLRSDRDVAFFLHSCCRLHSEGHR